MKAILKNRQQITTRDTLYEFTCPDISAKARPGQFVEIRITSGTDPYLRRPISIFDAEGDSFRVLVRNVGRGTNIISTWQTGHEADIIGPIGNGFSFFDQDQNVLIAAGGIGVAPLYFLARRLIEAGKNVTLLFSPHRDSKVLECFNIAEQLSLVFAENRNVLPVVLNGILAGDFDRIYACGPVGFLQTVSESGRETGVKVQVSVENRMACGIGVCLGCVVPIRRGDHELYLRACEDGPIFDGNEVIWDEMPT